MRQSMIATGGFTAAFFIGGMEGVEEEFALFRDRWPAVPAFPIASTGAAARRLFDQWEPSLPFLSMERVPQLRNDVVYTGVSRTVARAVTILLAEAAAYACMKAPEVFDGTSGVLQFSLR